MTVPVTTIKRRACASPGMLATGQGRDGRIAVGFVTTSAATFAFGGSISDKAANGQRMLGSRSPNFCDASSEFDGSPTTANPNEGGRRRGGVWFVVLASRPQRDRPPALVVDALDEIRERWLGSLCLTVLMRRGRLPCGGRCRRHQAIGPPGRPRLPVPPPRHGWQTLAAFWQKNLPILTNNQEVIHFWQILLIKESKKIERRILSREKGIYFWHERKSFAGQNLPELSKRL